MEDVLKLYSFGAGDQSHKCLDKAIVGGKGAALIEMAAMGLPVPPGIVIPTSECRIYLKNALKPDMQRTQLDQLTDRVIKFYEQSVVPEFGYMPLLSVRSGARVSMPGMMDTILNVGINQANHEEWKTRLGAECYQSCSERLISMYLHTVGHGVPDTLLDQLTGAIGAVFNSWNSERAVAYRKMHNYPDDWGTAVTVQAMVFGNLNEKSASGVLFSRDPATGENFVVGEFLPNAQGEDVVAGVRTPRQLHQMEQWNPAMLDEVLAVSGKLEEHYREAQDIEFTVQDGKLWVLQTRTAKRSAEAAFRIAHDLSIEGMISKTEAVRRVTATQYRMLMRPWIAPDFDVEATLTGIAASPGVVSGVAVFDSSKATKGAVLVRKETSPDDFSAMVQSAAILTAMGGATSHAAVVARAINRPAVVGVLEAFDKIKEGDLITLDGSTGRVWVNTVVPVVGGTLIPEARVLVEWALAATQAMMLHTASPTTELPKAGRYYVSVATLATQAGFRALLKKLADAPLLTGVLGFEQRSRALSEEDQKFLSLLALSNTVAPVQADSAKVTMLLKALISSSVPKKLKSRWQIHLPMTASDMQLETLTDAEWGVVRPVKTLKDLLLANGPVVFDAEFRTRMQGEQTSLEEILTVLRKAGRSISELGGLLDEKDFVDEVLGI